MVGFVTEGRPHLLTEGCAASRVYINLFDIHSNAIRQLYSNLLDIMVLYTL